jgi:hypothetical protein
MLRSTCVKVMLKVEVRRGSVPDRGFFRNHSTRDFELKLVCDVEEM